MLSDEERKAIDNVKSLLLYSKEHEYFSPFQEQEIDDMNIVLNIVEKQSKEIEELKALKREILINRIPCQFLEDYISKDKIKAKIEEYKKQIEKMEKDDVGIGFTLGKEWSDLKAKVEFGQSLLEKE